MPQQLPRTTATVSLMELAAQLVPQAFFRGAWLWAVTGCGYVSTIQPQAAPICYRSVCEVFTQMEELLSTACFSTSHLSFPPGGKKTRAQSGMGHSPADRENAPWICISTQTKCLWAPELRGSQWNKRSFAQPDPRESVQCTDQDEEQQKELMSSEMGSVALLYTQFRFMCRNDFPHPGTCIFIDKPAEVLQDQQLFAAA